MTAGGRPLASANSTLPPMSPWMTCGGEPLDSRARSGARWSRSPRTGSEYGAIGVSPHADRDRRRPTGSCGRGGSRARSPAPWPVRDETRSDTAARSSKRPGSCAPSSQRVADHPSSAHDPSGRVIGRPTRNSAPPATCASTVASHATSRSSATGFSTTGPARNDPPCPPGRRVDLRDVPAERGDDAG